MNGVDQVVPVDDRVEPRTPIENTPLNGTDQGLQPRVLDLATCTFDVEQE